MHGAIGPSVAREPKNHKRFGELVYLAMVETAGLFASLEQWLADGNIKVSVLSRFLIISACSNIMLYNETPASLKSLPVRLDGIAYGMEKGALNEVNFLVRQRRLDS